MGHLRLRRTHMRWPEGEKWVVSGFLNRSPRRHTPNEQFPRPDRHYPDLHRRSESRCPDRRTHRRLIRTETGSGSSLKERTELITILAFIHPGEPAWSRASPARWGSHAARVYKVKGGTTPPNPQCPDRLSPPPRVHVFCSLRCPDLQLRAVEADFVVDYVILLLVRSRRRESTIFSRDSPDTSQFQSFQPWDSG